MTSAARKILEEALSLPEEERADLIDALNESLVSGNGGLSAEWNAEIARRIESIEHGQSRLIPWDEVEAGIRESIGLRR